MTIEFGGVARLALFATPADLEDLVLGVLLGEGIAANAGDLLGVERVAQGEGRVLRPRLSTPPPRPRACRRGLWTASCERRAGGGPARCRRAGYRRPVASVEIGPRPWSPECARSRSARGSGSHRRQPRRRLDLLGRKLLLLRENVGRRNALDKLVGAMARAGIDPASGFAAVTSRVSHDLVRQAAAAGIGLLARCRRRPLSRSAWRIRWG